MEGVLIRTTPTKEQMQTDKVRVVATFKRQTSQETANQLQALEEDLGGLFVCDADGNLGSLMRVILITVVEIL
ncbi:hypothetical protein NDU88_002894 [Pleurodeles waltl]|uniref:Uncharacterized protein n=1 Tax=Pleurodeles waltl TaxID=8319 RepID=A0AAV7T4Y6_PLEWA|nr:hypothetical protein NDU88_002894 [Pleurodeles waltl]